MPAPLILADFSTTLTASVAIGATTGTLASVIDADGVTIPNGVYAFAVDSDITGIKEYFSATVTGVALTGVQNISRQGVVTTGFVRKHRYGAKVKITDWSILSYIGASASGTLVGSSTVSGGVTTRVLYDNAGVLGEYPVSGTGSVAMTTKPAINGTDPTGATYAPATGAQTVALDASTNNMHIVTGHASGTGITFTITGATNNQPFIVSILQGAVVSTITGWFATVRWAGGTAPTLTATVSKRDTFGFIRTGANTYDGYIVGQNS